MNDKLALRARLRAARDTFAVQRRPAPPSPHPAFIDRLRPGLVVASYAPLGSEADPSLWVEAARDAACVLALPHVVDRATPLRFLAWPNGADLAAGPFSLRNPAIDWPEVMPDVIITPLLGFDGLLHRLGQGAGHYDRAFAVHPAAWRVGIAWSVQRVDLVPVDPWDVPLHAIATEREWLTA